MNEKIDKYFKLLHPEYDTLTPGQQFELMDDRSFIADHIDEIDKYYEGCMREGSGAQQEGVTEQEIIVNALRKVKIGKYFGILHPEYDTLTPGEKYEVMDDRGFIADHIDEIDKYYEGCMREGSGAQQERLTEQQIIKEAIEKLSEKISVQAIGKATINTPTTAKKEAEQVENGENTRDNIKEGEKVGDDN